MARDPAFLFYSSDFLTGTSDLTMEERGQYITLLCLQHQKGRLTRKAVAIAVANATADVMAKFKIDKDGNFYNERLEIEADKRKSHSKKQKERALSGWKKRRAAAKAVADAVALPLEDVNENENENRFDNIIISKKEKETLIEKYGEDGYEFMVNKLSSYKLSKDVTYKSDYGAINSWVVKEWKKVSDKTDKKPTATSNLRDLVFKNIKK